MLKSFIGMIIISSSLFGNTLLNTFDYFWDDVFAYQKSFFGFSVGENNIKMKVTPSSASLKMDDGKFYKYSLGWEFYGERVYINYYDFGNYYNTDMKQYTLSFDYVFNPVFDNRWFIGSSIGKHTLKLDNTGNDFSFSETKVNLESLVYGAHVGYEYHEMNFGVDLRLEYLLYNGDVDVHDNGVAITLEVDRIYSAMLSFTFKF